MSEVSERLEDFQELATACTDRHWGPTSRRLCVSLDDAALAVRQGRGALDAQARPDHWDPDSKYLLIYPMVKTAPGTSSRSPPGRES